MSKSVRPITVFVADKLAAILAERKDADSRALTSGPGTLKFHALLAQHGAGEFKTLYAPMALKGKFAPPVGGEVREI